MALAAHHLIRNPPSPAPAPARPVSKSGRSSCFSPINFSASAKNQEEGGGGGGRRVWRRRKLVLEMVYVPLDDPNWTFWYFLKEGDDVDEEREFKSLYLCCYIWTLIFFLTKKDDKLRSLVERVPFLEERVRNIRDSGEILSMDIDRLMLSQENRFDFVNEVAAEATAYLENNRDEYGAKKPILHVISNRMNEAGFYRPEAYMEVDPFKPGPNFLKEELYD